MNLTNIKENKIKDVLLKVNWTPLHTRLVSHRIGDGTINFYGHVVYDNKNIEHFTKLANKLNIKLWITKGGDKYNTKKIVISRDLFIKFSRIFDVLLEDVTRYPTKLLGLISKLPEEHKLQTILALIVDDGSCKRWMITVFEDQNKEVFDKVKMLWDPLFPNTSRIYVYTTKKGTKVYHLKVNRNGIILLQQKINASVEKYGDLANLWWKQKDLDWRYFKATNRRAKLLNETKEFADEKKRKVLNHLQENKAVTLREVMQILNFSRDRAHLLLSKLVREGKIFATKAGNRSRYSVEREDISIEKRGKIITTYLKNQGRIYNKNVMKLLNLGNSKSYKILKELTLRGVLKQIIKKGKVYYVLNTR